jgi:hypothetical protein
VVQNSGLCTAASHDDSVNTERNAATGVQNSAHLRQLMHKLIVRLTADFDKLSPGIADGFLQLSNNKCSATGSNIADCAANFSNDFWPRR